QANHVLLEVPIFGRHTGTWLRGPRPCGRTWKTGRTVSQVSRRGEGATAVYITHPYLWNRSPAWVTTWSRGIGPSTATLRPPWLFMSFITNTSGAGPPPAAQSFNSVMVKPR